jgi:hypothetical protein
MPTLGGGGYYYYVPSPAPTASTLGGGLPSLGSSGADDDLANEAYRLGSDGDFAYLAGRLGNDITRVKALKDHLRNVLNTKTSGVAGRLGAGSGGSNLFNFLTDAALKFLTTNFGLVIPSQLDPAFNIIRKLVKQVVDEKSTKDQASDQDQGPPTRDQAAVVPTDSSAVPVDVSGTLYIKRRPRKRPGKVEPTPPDVTPDDSDSIDGVPPAPEP